MGKRSTDNMERWGVVDIFTEASALLFCHFRLFLPFFLAFQFPASFLSVSLNLFKVAPSASASSPEVPRPLSVVNGTTNPTPQEIIRDLVLEFGGLSSFIVAFTSSLLSVFLGTVALAAFTHVAASIYSAGDTERSDDYSVVKRVLKLLRPRVIFRVYVTWFWELLVGVPVEMAFAALAMMIFSGKVESVFTGAKTPTFNFLNVVEVHYHSLVGSTAMTIMFALTEPIAVLEPEKYGRAALKQSTKYARGRPGTISCLVISVTVIELTFNHAPVSAAEKAGLNLWVKIIAASLLSILHSVVNVYVGMVFIVMYFVSKANSQAVILPALQRDIALNQSAPETLPDGMGKRTPDGMATWGVVAIFKETKRVVHHHFRLFLPFFLAFQLPASLLYASPTIFLTVASGRPPPTTTSVNATANTTAQVWQGGDVHTVGGVSPFILITYTVSLLAGISSTLALVAFSFAVAYVYSDVGHTGLEDESVVRKVFKLLRPRAVFRLFVTEVWKNLALTLVEIVCVAIPFGGAYRLYGGPSPFVVARFVVNLVFTLARSVSLLEPGRYGSAALQQSIQYGRGRARTIFCIAVFSMVVVELSHAPARAVAKRELPLLVKITLTSLLSILSSVVSAYARLIGVVLFFVCKSSFISRSEAAHTD